MLLDLRLIEKQLILISYTLFDGISISHEWQAEGLNIRCIMIILTKKMMLSQYGISLTRIIIS